MENFFTYDDIKDSYDVTIIGAGPTGLTAGIYAGRDNLETIILEKSFPGGQAAMTEIIENYPGFPKGVKGSELSELMYAHALNFNVQIKNCTYKKIDLNNKIKTIDIEGKDVKINTKTIIIASGVRPKHLEIPGEDKFIGKGISFCATCDGAFYKNKIIAVVGGGDSAVEEGIYLTRFASKVYIIHRRNSLRATKILQKRALSNPKIEFIWNTDVKTINGSNQIESITVFDKNNQKGYNLTVSGVFVYIGWTADTEIFKGQLDMDEFGFIKADETTKTVLPGVFVAGDVRLKKFRQIVTAISDGAVAAKMAEQYIDENFSEVNKNG
jgi:thioredoxin reductase (NADPH)